MAVTNTRSGRTATGYAYSDGSFALTIAAQSGDTLSIVTLAFGIAAATTTFSAVYAALFRAVPFSEPERLLYLHTTRHTQRPSWCTLPRRSAVAMKMSVRRSDSSSVRSNAS